MMRRYTLLVIILSVFSSAKADALKHDPFARPLLAVALSSGVATASKDQSGDESVGAESTWSPKLTAVLLAGKNSLVNTDGKIIRVGEEVDGYRLVQVRDSEAVFSKNKKSFVLHMETQAPKESKDRGRL